MPKGEIIGVPILVSLLTRAIGPSGKVKLAPKAKADVSKELNKAEKEVRFIRHMFFAKTNDLEEQESPKGA